MQLQLQLQLRYITLHYTTLTTLHYGTLNYLQLRLQLHYTTLHYTRLHYSTQHFSTVHYISSYGYTHYTTPQLQLRLQLQLHYTNYTTLQLQLDYATTTITAALQPAVVSEDSKKAQLQPLFRPSVDSLCHPCITATHLSYSVLSYLWRFRHRLVRYWCEDIHGPQQPRGYKIAVWAFLWWQVRAWLQPAWEVFLDADPHTRNHTLHRDTKTSTTASWSIRSSWRWVREALVWQVYFVSGNWF